jgi:hypothetical protein
MIIRAKVKKKEKSRGIFNTLVVAVEAETHWEIARITTQGT